MKATTLIAIMLIPVSIMASIELTGAIILAYHTVEGDLLFLGGMGIAGILALIILTHHLTTGERE